MNRHEIVTTLFCAILVIMGICGSAEGDAIPDVPTKADIHIKPAKPLSPKDSYETKFLSYQSAEDDYDFRRFIVLFERCAEDGDPLCQYFLADGVSQWLEYNIYPHDKTYDERFVRKWLRSASKSLEAYGFVTLNWSAYYFSGRMGFPKDRELYLCWREVKNSNNDMSEKAVQARFDHCRMLEKNKYGDAFWLKD